MKYIIGLSLIIAFTLTAAKCFAQDQSIRDLDFLIGTWEVREDNDKKTWWEKCIRNVSYTLDSTYIKLEANALSSSGKQRTYLWLIHYNNQAQQFEMVSMFSNWHKIQLDILTWEADTRTLTITNNTNYAEFPERYGQLVFAEDLQSYQWRGENKYGDPNEPSIWRYLEVGKKVKPLMGHLGRPHLSPDGTQIAFVHTPDEDQVAREIYVANLIGGEVTAITDFPEAKIKKGPVWSPDGSKIAFHADLKGGAQIYVVDGDGQNLTALTNLPGYNVEPHWSPDGKKIAFNAILPDQKALMYAINGDGSGLKQLPNPEGDNWYPRLIDEQRVLFTSDLDHADFYDVYLMNQDGSQRQTLTRVKSINWFPEISPNGKYIIFHSNRDDPQLSGSGDFNLYLMNTDGSGLRQLTDWPGQELHAKWHASGKKLIFEWYQDGSKGFYLMDIDADTFTKINLVH